jgi:hypothetical protein
MESLCEDLLQNTPGIGAFRRFVSEDSDLYIISIVAFLRAINYARAIKKSTRVISRVISAYQLQNLVKDVPE